MDARRYEPAELDGEFSWFRDEEHGMPFDLPAEAFDRLTGGTPDPYAGPARWRDYPSAEAAQSDRVNAMEGQS